VEADKEKSLTGIESGFWFNIVNGFSFVISNVEPVHRGGRNL
jgi:hypothetical protein